jgi:hypothetical protein
LREILLGGRGFWNRTFLDRHAGRIACLTFSQARVPVSRLRRSGAEREREGPLGAGLEAVHWMPHAEARRTRSMEHPEALGVTHIRPLS